MDVEEQTILVAVFKDSFSDSWKNKPEFLHYLSQLSSYGLEKLNHEPARLAEERAEILEQTQNLAFNNYKTFIETAECSKEILQDFSAVEVHVNTLLGKLPVFTEKCNSFLKKAQEINNSRKMNSLTLSKHTHLLEILEIPQLMDTCVRNGYYEEALELAAYVRRLEKKHSNIPVIQDIVKEVYNCSQLMLNQLIQQLRTTIQLPACLRVIGYLRRMDVFTEKELRIKFLQARDAWYQNLIGAIPKEDAYYHISKVIEASRVHLFDIITQYRAIFSDEDPLVSTSQQKSKTNDSFLFYGWVVQKVSQFIQLLEDDLEHGVGNRLDSLLGQCMYFGLSFSRVGADFRWMLAPLFQKASLTAFTIALQDATRRFEDAMQSYTLIAAPAVLMSTAITTTVTQGDSSLNPPFALMDHLPLANYTNSVLIAFNDLRLFAPVGIAVDITRALSSSLTRVVTSVLTFHKTEEATFNQNEKELFSELCRVLVEELVPYLSRCLHAICSPATLAQTLGVATSELKNLGNSTTIIVSDIVEPLQNLLPIKEEPEIATATTVALSGTGTEEDNISISKISEEEETSTFDVEENQMNKNDEKPSSPEQSVHPPEALEKEELVENFTSELPKDHNDESISEAKSLIQNTEEDQHLK